MLRVCARNKTFAANHLVQGMKMFLRNSSMSVEQSYTFHRGEVQTVFLKHLHPSNQVICGKRIVSYTDSKHGEGPVQLHFEDGTTATCDVLVGSDGLRSAVRASMYTQLAEAATKEGKDIEAQELRSHIAPVFSGSLIYRTIIRKDTLPPEVASKPAFNRPGLMLVSPLMQFLLQC